VGDGSEDVRRGRGQTCPAYDIDALGLVVLRPVEHGLEDLGERRRDRVVTDEQRCHAGGFA